MSRLFLFSLSVNLFKQKYRISEKCLDSEDKFFMAWRSSLGCLTVNIKSLIVFSLPSVDLVRGTSKMCWKLRFQLTLNDVFIGNQNALTVCRVAVCKTFILSSLSVNTTLFFSFSTTECNTMLAFKKRLSKTLNYHQSRLSPLCVGEPFI